MEDFINSLKDTNVYLEEQDRNLINAIAELKEQGNPLRSYLLYKMMADYATKELQAIDTTDIEKRVVEAANAVEKEANGILDGVKVHANWLQDIIVALNCLGSNEDLKNRNDSLHGQITGMEEELKKLIEIRNNKPLGEIGKE